MKEISVVVCTRNRPAQLARALTSLAEQTLARTRYEVVVSDNGDGSGVDLAHAHGAEVVLHVSEPGVSGTRNAGWRAASAPVLAFLDDDAIASADWLEHGLALFDGAAAGAGGPILPLYDARPPAWFRDEYELRTWGDKERLLKPGESFSASNLFLTREALEAVGGFDTRLGMRAGHLAVGEEPAFFARLWLQPDTCVVYSPRVVVHHWVAANKTTVRYQLRRASAAGDAWAVQTARRRRDCARDIGAATALAARAVARFRRPWQRWAVEELGPVAARLGSVRGALR